MEVLIPLMIKILGLSLGIGTLLFTLPKLARKPGIGLPIGHHLPGVSFEVARNVGEVRDIIEKVPRPTRKIRRELKIDQYIIAPLYISLFAALGIWIIYTNLSFSWYLGIIAIINTVLVGLFDTLENIRTILVLNAYEKEELESALVVQMRRASISKWAFVALETALLSFMFVLIGWFIFGEWLVTGILYLLTTITLVLGIIRYRPFIEWGFCLMGLSWISTAVAFILVY